MSENSADIAQGHRRILAAGWPTRSAAGEAGRASVCGDYCRERDLPGVLGLWPEEVRDNSEAGTRMLIEKLRSALRAERQCGRAGHWSYDLNRHLKLVVAYREECAALQRLLRPVGRGGVQVSPDLVSH